MSKTNVVRVEEYVRGEGFRYFGQCIHEWEKTPTMPGAVFDETCTSCGAMCARDSRRRIIEFDAKIPPPAPIEFKRRPRRASAAKVEVLS